MFMTMDFPATSQTLTLTEEWGHFQPEISSPYKLIRHLNAKKGHQEISRSLRENEGGYLSVYDCHPFATNPFQTGD